MENQFAKKLLSAIISVVLLFVLAACKEDESPVDKTNEKTAETKENEITSEIATEVMIGGSEPADTIEKETEAETEPESESEKNTTASKTQKPEYTYPAYETPKYYSYLTGKKCTRTQQRKRPVSIMINNIRGALPNVGISHADIIYECMVEGGITRLMMVLADYENVPVFGSVRSSREYFIDLSRTHDTIYVHAGGNPQDYDQFDLRPIDRMDGVNMYFPNTFYRDSERRKTMALEHTLMTSGTGIVDGIKRQNYRTTLKPEYKGAFNFYEESTDIGGTNNTANYISVPYSNAFKAEFIYKTDDKLYYRKQYGAAHTDGATGEQIKFENVIVIFAEYAPFRGNAIAIKEGHWSCDLTGTGYGFYITGGKYKIIKWQKDTRESMLILYNSDNTKLFLNPGKSFICVTSKAYNKSVVINSDIKNVW
ncbi:MAG: DUF3048 domain-containing protein [Oscillospiraceae bacterium]|nr:DUF3048 domain-containing protein [Oscillospiraceae bacterium]